MKTSEIKELCLNGSKAYYEFLSSKPDGGVNEVRIHKIEQVNDRVFKLSVAQRLFDPDSICFRYNGSHLETFTTDDIKIKLYDNDKRVVVVRVEPRVAPLLATGSHNDWKVIVDLKFLVQRVIDWYQENGNRLQKVTMSSEDEFDDGVLMPSMGTPTDQQMRAIKAIFENPMTYIWGAPGTGKTRFVLSYALLHYIKREKKVLVLAPTNVALEQVMSGVIEMTDEAGVERKKVLRLGFPTKEFANRYGEVCEIQGIEKEIKGITNQIDILSGILGEDSDEELLISSNVETLVEHQEIYNQQRKIGSELKEKVRRESTLQASVDKINRQLQMLKDDRIRLIQEKNKLWTKMVAVFGARRDYDSEIGSIESEIDTQTSKLSEEKGNLEQALALSSYAKKQLHQVVESLSKKRDELISSFRSEELEENAIEDTIEDQRSRLKSLQEERAIKKSMAAEYKGLPESSLRIILRQLIGEKEKLEQYSLDQRVETAQVIGSTLDTYLHRYKEKKLGVDHVFIDEAGYASVVKAFTVFTEGIPVTLLGDHKQLPPVCEVSRLDINKGKENSDIFVWDHSAIYVDDIWSASNKEGALMAYQRVLAPSFKGMTKCSLTKSHRFGPNLADALKRVVYTEDGFSSAIQSNTEIVIFDCPNPAENRRGNRLNEAEALAIRDLIVNQFRPEHSVAILAPYRDQIRRLNQLLPDFKDQNKILTVHKSQGREWDVIIYSVCDYGNGKSPWFTNSMSPISTGLNNVNTAVSRAKKQLIIFCSLADWQGQNGQLITGLIGAATKVVRN